MFPEGASLLNQTVMTILQSALLSMTPVLELRGALPWAIARGLDPWFAYVLCVVCNMVPVPFILLFINKVLEWMSGTRHFAGLSRWLLERARKKMDVYYKYEVLGLFILVAIPLPGTGAWTGALVAALMGVKLRAAVPTIALGVADAGLIMLTVSMGVVSVLG